MQFYGVETDTVPTRANRQQQEQQPYHNFDAVPDAPAGPSTKLPSRITPDGEVFDVAAPATLPAGFKFRAQSLDGRTFTATVPEGGVSSGDNFTVAPAPDEVYPSDANGPVGRWRDGVFDCFKDTYFHLPFWSATVCPQLTNGQIMTRMGLNAFGFPTTSNHTFKWIFVFIALYNITLVVVDAVSPLYQYEDTSFVMMNAGAWVRLSLTVSLFLYTVCAVAKVRGHVRWRYSIPSYTACGRLEDFCLSMWCSACTISQMNRHTADYVKYKADCLTDTGLERGGPRLV